jgi:hypothetical protein
MLATWRGIRNGIMITDDDMETTSIEAYGILL